MRPLFRSLVIASSLFGSTAALAADAPQGQVAPQVQKAARPTLDVVFVLDTTGSMSGLIEGAKQKIWSIASRMASGHPAPRIRVGLVGYRDRGDEYVTKRFELSEDLDAVYANLQGFSAGGGGDGPEHVGQALGEAVSLMQWSQDSRTARMIFLVGDAPAHDDYKDGWNTRVWAKKAIEKGIVVNTVRCGGDPNTGALFAELAKLADGTFVSIAQSGGMVAVATPFDGDIKKLNDEIADTTLTGGDVAVRREAAAELGAFKSMGAGTLADRSSYRSKMAPAAAPMVEVKARGSVSLNADPSKVNAMKDEELPDAVRALPKGEREGYVRKLNDEQKQAQAKLVELSKKRDEWIKSNASKKADSFDDQVFAGVKKSAEKVGVAY